ncbi:hypothetical protein R83H12_01512 [Fibrobacteria bacterium R8-3-H12]
MKHGFTLLEVLIVVIIIGILSTLGYSSINELIQTNKAKEAARLMTAFVERSLVESKTRKDSVTIKITGNVIQAAIGTGTGSFNASETISNGFSAGNSMPEDCVTANRQIISVPDITTMFRIDTDTITGPVCFVVCNSGGYYCGAAVKVTTSNYFTAKIKKKSSAGWEAL